MPDRVGDGDPVGAFGIGDAIAGSCAWSSEVGAIGVKGWLALQPVSTDPHMSAAVSMSPRRRPPRGSRRRSVGPVRLSNNNRSGETLVAPRTYSFMALPQKNPRLSYMKVAAVR